MFKRLLFILLLLKNIRLNSGLFSCAVKIFWCFSHIKYIVILNSIFSVISECLFLYYYIRNLMIQYLL